ncbi:MAG: cytochrome b N-terminal domain-containing protein [Armatimonadota bacterium]|nr:cytochrome b N-terminal domain-containing protein [Armatimonadota bacterium]MDR5702841.1 cytochrome b N-terminal domain-containing protein [Armatimonadota bacterium]MDR7435067.1 cytochrome b N-terminal domain-containing protein [Armatimonadota bacterium]
MGKLGVVGEWIKDRKEHLDLFDETNVHRQGNPFYLLGPMVYYFWLITIVSGLLLMIWYEPTTAGAYNSILHIQHEIPLGWLIRGLHKYGADALIIAITLRIYRMYFLGEYKKPGELSWMIAFASLILAMISGITGYLLIWNQRAFWAAKVVLTVPIYFDELPLIGQTRFGSAIAYIFLGGPAIGQATLTRFYMIHFSISVIALILTEIFFQRTRRKRLNMSLASVLVFFLMLAAISYLLPAELGRRANPDRTPLPILSDWYFLALYQFVKYTPPLWAGLGPGLLIAFGMLVPFLDRSKGRRPSERPFFTVVGIMALVYFLVFTVLILFNIAVIERDPPIILAITVVVLALGLLWEIRYRRRQLGQLVSSPKPAENPASE